MESDGAIESFIYRNIPWKTLEKVQQELILRAQDCPTKKFLVLSEPHPTFTYGRNASRTDLLWQTDQLKNEAIEVAPVSRGGKWTYHGPGQILIYPIGTLATWGFSSKQAKLFLELFRECIAEAISNLGVCVRSKDEPYGLYVNHQKITSFGMSFEKGISSHGAALYVTPQKEFAGIIPCGFQNTRYTCLSEQLPQADWLIAANAVLLSIKKGFKLV